MLDTLKRASIRLRFLLPVFMVLGLACISVLVAEIFITILPGQDDVLMIPAAVLFLWSLVATLAISTFPTVPDQDPGARLMARLRLAFTRMGYYLLALAFVALTAASVYLTNKLMGIWIG